MQKLTYIQRFYDGEPLGEPISKIVEPKTRHRYHVPSGYYELGHRKMDGTYQAWQTREGEKWKAIPVCGTAVINMAEIVVPTIKKSVLRPRKQ